MINYITLLPGTVIRYLSAELYLFNRFFKIIKIFTKSGTGKYLLLFILLTVNSTYAFDHYVHVRVTNYPPLYYIDSEGNWSGVDVELAKTVIREAGFEPKFLSIAWSGALRRMRFGGLDFMTNLTKTQKRSEYMNWIGPERNSVTSLIVMKKDIDLPVWSLDDISIISEETGKKFGVIKGARYSKEFNKRIIDENFAAYFEQTSVPDSNIKKLTSGRILGFFAEKVAIKYKIRTDPLYKNVVVHNFTLDNRPVYFGVSKKVPASMQNLLKESFEKLDESGVLDEIRSREW